MCFPYAAPETIALSIIVKGCLAYILYFDDATPVMRDMTLLKEYPLISFIYRHGQDLIQSISNFTGDSALCQLLADLLMSMPSSLPGFELLDWDRTWDNLPDNRYEPGRMPLERYKIRQPLLIAGELSWTHAAKGLVRASVNSNHPDTAPTVQLLENEQIQILCAAAGGPTGWDHVFNYVLENLVRMPDNCCEVEASWPITRLQKVKNTVADSLLDDGPDDAAVRLYIYSEAAGCLLLKHSLDGLFMRRVSSGRLRFIFETLSERYGKPTTGGNHEDHVTSRSRPSIGSISQEKTSSHNGVQGPKRTHGSLLHAAAFHGRFAMVEELLNEGADVNLRVEPHLTALHAAASTPYHSSLTLLLD